MVWSGLVCSLAESIRSGLRRALRGFGRTDGCDRSFGSVPPFSRTGAIFAPVAGRLVRLIERWDRSNQERADRGERRRRDRPSYRRQVNAMDGACWSLVAQQHGYPDIDRYTGSTILVPALPALALDGVFFLRHRFVLGGAWRVNLVGLDERGFATKESRRIVAPSKVAVLRSMHEVAELVQHEGPHRRGRLLESVALPLS